MDAGRRNSAGRGPKNVGPRSAPRRQTALEDGLKPRVLSLEERVRQEMALYEAPDVESQKPLFSQESTVQLTAFGTSVFDQEDSEAGLQDIRVRPTHHTDGTEAQPGASPRSAAQHAYERQEAQSGPSPRIAALHDDEPQTQPYASPRIATLQTEPSTSTTDGLLDEPLAYAPLGVSNMSASILEPVPPSFSSQRYSSNRPSSALPCLFSRTGPVYIMCFCRNSKFRPTLAAMRKANKRFSVLRTRVMQRSASAGSSILGESADQYQVQQSSISVSESHWSLVSSGKSFHCSVSPTNPCIGAFMTTCQPGGRLRFLRCGWLYAAGSIFDMLNNDDRDSLRAKASFWLEGIYATIAISVVTFFALFLDDFRVAVLPIALDVSCEYISGLILVSSPIPATLNSDSSTTASCEWNDLDAWSGTQWGTPSTCALGITLKELLLSCRSCSALSCRWRAGCGRATLAACTSG